MTTERKMVLGVVNSILVGVAGATIANKLAMSVCKATKNYPLLGLALSGVVYVVSYHATAEFADEVMDAILDDGNDAQETSKVSDNYKSENVDRTID